MKDAARDLMQREENIVHAIISRNIENINGLEWHQIIRWWPTQESVLELWMFASFATHNIQLLSLEVWHV